MRSALTGAAAVLIAGLTASAMAASGDITMQRKGADAAAREIAVSVFPHTLHRVLFKCYVCHEAIFKMKVGANPVTMDAIFAGKFCGACHDGKTAFGATFGTCDRCHQQ